MPSEEFKQFKMKPPAFTPPEFSAATDFKKLRQASDEAAAKMPLPDDVAYKGDTLGGVAAEWVIPENSPADKAILHLHGGGFVEGSIINHRHFLAAMAKEAGIKVASLEYRLAPENTYPAAPDDCVAAYRAMREQGIPAKGIVIAGGSAGGNLSLVTVLRLKDEGDDLPAAVVAMAPVTDFLATGESYRTLADDPLAAAIKGVAGLYVPGEDLENPYISPLYGDYRGFPSLLLQVGTADVLLDDSVMLAERARAQGADVTLKIWEEMGHGFVGDFGNYPEADAALREIAEFIKLYLGGV